MKAGDAEEDGLRLGVVAGSISIGDHGAITAEHLHGCGHLEKGTGQKQLTRAFGLGSVRMVGESLVPKTSVLFVSLSVSSSWI